MSGKRFAALAVAVVSWAACGGGADKPNKYVADAQFIDGPQGAPVITSFVATPNQATSGVATAITWTWTFETEPALPAATCSIDNGVGAVKRGDTTMVTLTQVTTFTLTCMNSLGQSARQVVVGVPPVAPQIATFTTSPSTITSNTATPVTFSWTYANAPTPAPTCTIEWGVGAITSGSQSTVTQPGSRAYTLTCTNPQGSTTAVATVNVNECTEGTAQCDANANCADATNGYTCTCKTGYTGNGDTCGTNQACPGTACGANASCQSGGAGTYCACNTGYVGDGVTCTKERVTFVTSTTGQGNLSAWSGATGTGVAAGDAVCAARASAAGLTGTFVAWLSDSTTDAYCHVHGFTGKKSANCGQSSLPATAGPWVRLDSTRSAALPRIDKLVAPTRQTFALANLTESGSTLSSTERVYTGTDDNGVALANTCTDWTASSTVTGAMGSVSGGGTAWTHDTSSDPTCSSFAHLRCVETGAGSGPALPPRHPANVRRAFLTSVGGSGSFSTWADSGGINGSDGADAVCRARARYAGIANPQNFYAWVSSYNTGSVYNRVYRNTSNPWARLDGVLVGTYSNFFSTGTFVAPLDQMETGAYATGNLDSGSVWTGTYSYGYPNYSYYCSGFQYSTSYSAIIGRYDFGDSRATNYTTSACSAVEQIYCLEDD